MRGSAPGRRRVGPAGRSDDQGFTLVELMMAMSVFSILIVGFALLFASTLKSFTASRAQTAAGQLASTELEKARNVGWDNLGTVLGNPPGTLVAGPETVTVGSLTFSVTRRVELVDDPVPDGFSTGANYKRVIVRVTAPVMSTPVVVETLVAPPVQPSLYSGVIKARVVSKVTSAPIANATVALTGGPSSNRSDSTDVDGNVTFPALTPHSNTTTYYTLTPTLTGWKAHASVTTDGQINLAPGDVITRTLHMYKPGTITVKLVDLGGDPVTTPVTLTFDSDTNPATAGDTRSFTSATGELVLTTFKGGDIVPGDTYTFEASSVGYTMAPAVTETLAPANYPTNVDSTVTLQLPIPARVDTTLRFVDKTTGLPLVVSGTLTGTPGAGPDDPGAFTTDVDGLAVFRLLPRTVPDQYRVVVNLPGYYPYAANVAVTGTPDPLALTLELEPLPPPTPVTFAVRGGSPVAPLPAIPVVVSGGPSGTVTFTTDAAGQGTVDLVSGSYSVSVNTPGYLPYTGTVTVTTGMPVFDVVLGSQGAVTIETRNATTTALVGPVEMTLVGPSGSVPVSVGAGGSTFLYLNPGTYTVTTSSVPAGFGAYSGTVTVVSGPQTVTVSLSDQGQVTLRTRNAAGGAALGSVSVGLTGPSGSSTVTTDASGLSAVLGLAPGTYTYSTSVSGFAPNKGTFTVTGGAQTVDILVTQGVSVTFRTRDQDNTSLRVGPVTLRIKDGPGADQVFTTSTGGSTSGSGGTYTTLVVPGTYTVEGSAFPAGWTAVVTTSVTITGGGNTNVIVT